MTDDVKQQPDEPDATTADGSETAREKTAAEKKREPVKVLGMPLPTPVSDAFYGLRDFGDGLRRSTITALPSFIVNSSSNVIAVTQLSGEALMFKSNNTVFVKPEHRGWKNWWRYIVEPPKAMFGSVFSNAATSATAKDFLRPSFYVESVKNLFDLEAATKLDSAGGRQLLNRWQARSGFSGLASMALVAVVPDAKDTPEDLEKMAVLSHTNPVGYVGARIWRGLCFPFESVVGLVQKVLPGEQKEENQLGKHKREFAALGLTMAGMFSILTGFRNIGAINPEISSRIAGNQKYVRNAAHSWGGAITAFGGINMLLAPDNDTGWGRFGIISWFRMMFVPKSIYNRYHMKDPNRHYYAGGVATLQGMNTVSYLIGGAEKLEDGTIVDHNEMRLEAKHKANEEKIRRKEEKEVGTDGEKPATKVSHRVMEERLATSPALAQDFNG